MGWTDYMKKGLEYAIDPTAQARDAYDFVTGGNIAGDAANTVGLGTVPKVNATYGDPAGFTYGGDANYYKNLRDRHAQQEGQGLEQANQDYANSGLARSQMQQMADQYGRVAAGKAGPSLAEQQMRAGQQQAAQQAAQMAASTRGGTGAMLAAQRAAQTQSVLGQQDVAQQAGMLRAKEVQQARDAQAGLLGAMRQQDLSSRGQGQQEALGYAGAQHAATMGALQGSMGLQQANMQANQWEQQTNAQLAESAMQRKAKFSQGVLDTGARGLGMAATGGFGSFGGG